MIEALRFVSGVLFWALVAVILAGVWGRVIIRIIRDIFGSDEDD